MSVSAEFLRTIAQLPRLKHLTLRTQTTGKKLDTDNDLDAEYAQSVWSFLRSQQRHDPISKLSLHILQRVWFQASEGDPGKIKRVVDTKKLKHTVATEREFVFDWSTGDEFIEPMEWYYIHKRGA